MRRARARSHLPRPPAPPRADGLPCPGQFSITGASSTLHENYRSF